MQRVIVTGTNGAGKSHLAARMRDARPDIPLVPFDAIKLTSGWRQSPLAEIDRALSKVVATEAWIVEGGPSLLGLALARADGVIWLDPPEIQRIWRLASRPWKNLGRTRPELPPNNVDWPLQQYRFAIQSIRNGGKLRNRIAATLDPDPAIPVWRCRNRKQAEAALEAWKAAGGNSPTHVE